MDVVRLVKEAKQGDKEALVTLVMDKKNDYYRLAYVYIGNKDDTLDVMEDMIVILYENISKLRDVEAFYSWSKTILVNCCRNFLRRKKKVVPVEEFIEEGFIDKYENREQGIDLQEHIQKLNEHQQEAIKLRFFLDMDYKTISEITKVPKGTVKSRISTGLSKLKALLGGEY